MEGEYLSLDTAKKIAEKDKEIERLKQDNEYLNKVNIELSSRNSKATKYIKENICTFPAIPQGVYDLRNINLDKLLDILKGSDKE